MSLRQWILLLSSLGAVAFAAGAGCPQGGTTPIPADNTVALAGQTDFNSLCASCHGASALAPFAGRVTNNMGTVNSRMNGIQLTDQQVTEIKAFLATQ